MDNYEHFLSIGVHRDQLDEGINSINILASRSSPEFQQAMQQEAMQQEAIQQEAMRQDTIRQEAIQKLLQIQKDIQQRLSYINEQLHSSRPMVGPPLPSYVRMRDNYLFEREALNEHLAEIQLELNNAGYVASDHPGASSWSAWTATTSR